MAKGPTVCICVPVWKGSCFVAETLSSILKQEGAEFVVRVSVDGADTESAEICSEFLADERVKLDVQPTRLGWVKNTNWLLDRADGDYVCIQPQDDLIAENYLSTLLSVSEATRGVSVVYSDIESFGSLNGTITQTSVTGSPLTRQLALLLDHFAAVAFRGLTKTSALRRVGGLAGSSYEDYAADTVWMAQLARTGELHRVPLPLYRKRFHSANTHWAWRRWSRDERIAAWGQHCADMLAQALAIDGLDGTRRAMLARASVLRAYSARGFADSAQFSNDERRQMMVSFIEAAKRRSAIHWEEMFAGFDEFVLDDVFKGRPYPSPEQELKRVSSRLRTIEQSALWQLASACGRAASRVPFARTLSRRFFGA